MYKRQLEGWVEEFGASIGFDYRLAPYDLQGSLAPVSYTHLDVYKRQMFGNAKRTTTGLDFNRASLIMAVLEKRAGLLLQNQDAYLKSAGGVKLDEPAIDLAVAVAIASSYKDLPTNPQECFIGEIGLTGEIRRVNRIEQRINEAAKLGFTKVYACLLYTSRCV